MAFWPRSPGGAAAVSSRPWWLPLGTPDPADLAWTWYSQGGASVADLADGGVALTVPASEGAGRERPVSGSSWTRTMWFTPGGIQNTAGGMIFSMWARRSASGEISTYHYNLTTASAQVAYWAGARYATTSFGGSPVDSPTINYFGGFASPVVAVRMVWNGTTIRMYVSMDGRNFNIAHTTTPAAAPDFCGFYAENANVDSAVFQIQGWEES